MIKRLQGHLTFLFTAATGATLTIILCIIFIFMTRTETMQSEAYFQNQLLNLTNKLESDITFSDNWLAKTEADGKLIIHIEENRTPLFFSGAWSPATDRDILIEKAQKKAAVMGVSVSHGPFSTSLAKSDVFLLDGNANDRYRAYVLTVPFGDSFRSLTLLQNATFLTQNKIMQILFFVSLGLCGILVLHLISRMTIKRTLAPVIEAQIRQTEFVASASHELRSPLAVIQASASAITALPERASEMSLAIQKECTRAGNLVKDLLVLASADSDSLVLDKSYFDADRVLLRLYEAYDPLCQSKGIRLRLVMPEDFLPQVCSAEPYVYQILSVLIDNAIAYGCSADDVGEITLSASYMESYVILSVADHGPGIPDGEKEHIFDRFYKGDKSRSKKEHFGLGLSIADKLAGQLKIGIKIEDTDGGGATFRVMIPLK